MFVFKELWGVFKKLIKGSFGWFLIVPLAFLVPKKKNSIAVIGRDNGLFLDNTKYFFLDLHEKLNFKNITFISEHEDQVQLLKSHGYSAIYYPSIPAILYLLRTKVLVIDTSEWTRNFKGYICHFSKRVQLWHGVGFKKIQIEKWRDEVQSKRILSNNILLKFRIILKKINYNLVRYHVFISTSSFYKDNVFMKAFFSDNFIINGYPRNSFEFNNKKYLLNIDFKGYDFINNAINKGKEIIIYIPTFRDSRKSDSVIKLFLTSEFDQWCVDNNFIFIIKPHPSERGNYSINGLESIYLYESDSDIYPLLPFTSAMVTDYSSVYMDYLHLDKPVLFFCPDLEQYIAEDRSIQFDYHEMTPGLKLKDFESLKKSLLSELKLDTYKSQRALLKKKAFDDIDQSHSTERLIQYLVQKKWMDK